MLAPGSDVRALAMPKKYSQAQQAEKNGLVGVDDA
jgi:hypothetical protein